MKNTRLLMVILGILFMFTTLANAGVIDVVQSPTNYFAPDQASTYSSPYYRWYNEDWGWTHGAIGGTITTATLNISAWDVDAAQGEVDKIYAYDNGTSTYLGDLVGLDGDWGYSTFTLGSNFFDDINNGLQVYMNIDSTHNQDWWAVALSKSVLSVDGGTLPPPGPGPSTIPEPATMSLLGMGLLGLLRFKKKA